MAVFANGPSKQTIRLNEVLSVGSCSDRINVYKKRHQETFSLSIHALRKGHLGIWLKGGWL